MASARPAEPQSSSGTQETLEALEALELLLGILPNTRQLSQLIAAETTRPAIAFEALVTHFQAATYLLFGHLEELKKADAVEIGADAIHRAAHCLEKLVGPTHVPANLQTTLNSYLNLQNVCRLPTSQARKSLFYQALKNKWKDLGQAALQTLSRCGEDLQACVTDTGQDLDLIPPTPEYANDFDDIWESIKNAYNALLVCDCRTEGAHETALQLATKLKQEELHDYYSLDILISGAHSVCPNEVHFLVTGKLSSTRQVGVDSSHKSSRKEIACSCSTWMKNPEPSRLRANFALEGKQLWALDLSQRMFPLEEQYQQISLGDLIQSNSAGWPLVVKLILVVILAHSLLYLTDGPWLGGIWSRSKIVFYRNRAFVSARPFVRTQISNVASINLDLRDGCHRYPGILEFGIALLEIHLGRRIDEPSFTRYQLYGKACRLMCEQQYNMQDNYRNAVRACLQPDFGLEAGVTSQKFRKRIFDKIVSPLNREFENGFKGIIEPSSLDMFAAKFDLISGQFSDVSSIQNPTIPPRPNITRGIACHRPASKIHISETNLRVQSTIIESPDRLLITADGLTPARSTSFGLFEEENQSQDISQRLCQQTDTWINRFKRLVNSTLNSNVTDKNRIKVAILDSGIDIENTDIDAQSDRIKDIRSWVDGKAGEEARRGGDISGHGTHIAGIILDLAPNVDVYIARVTKTSKLDDTEQILKALEYSWRTWDVDMITMSFGFQHFIPKIRKEIKEAEHRGKIVFAAASNGGGNWRRAFPASQSRVICVHSSDPNGNKSLYNPSPNLRGDNFTILGQYIKSCWPGAEEAGASRRMTGTSFATAVAVALAAFIIGYIEQEIPGLSTCIELKSYDGVVSLFRLFLKANNGPRDGYDLIAPFEFFRRFEPSKIREDILDALNP